jgi:ABC-type branched-subunit amino acid transport system substrate-binding protein
MTAALRIKNSLSSGDYVTSNIVECDFSRLRNLALRLSRNPVSFLVFALAFLSHISSAVRADEAEAAGPRHTIAVHMTSPADGCYDPGVRKAIEHFVKQRVAEVNRYPELVIRKLRVEFYNDRDDPKLAIENVRKALADPTTIAMVGLSGSKRAPAVFEALGSEIANSKIPFISDIGTSDTFAAYPNVFTMRPSQEEERLPVMGRFIVDGKYQKPAFVGIADNPSIDALVAGLGKQFGMPTLVATHRLAVKDNEFDATLMKALVDDIKAREADIAIVALGAAPSTEFLKLATAAGVTVPVLFVFGSDAILKTPEAKVYGNDIYQLAWDTLPDVYNNRLRERIAKASEDIWIFEDTPVAGASGWSSGVCKPKTETAPQAVFSSANLRAIGRGTQFADMIGLIGEIARSAPDIENLSAFRAHITEKLQTAYIAGRGTYRGEFDNWSFKADSRSAARTPAILIHPRGTEFAQLAPTQYVRLRNDSLHAIQTIYMDIDLNRIFRVDDNEKSFFAEFYMSMRTGGAVGMDNIEFGNAFLDAEDGGAKLLVNSLHSGGPSSVYPEGVQISKVVGKFMMSPNLSNYPFDTQLFSVQLQPKNGENAFIIQPPREVLRDRDSQSDGWVMIDQYVGFDEDYIPLTDARNAEKSVVPFYKMNFSWVMKREATDYYLRVVIPLIFILIVAYLSIFIPREHFEAIVTIQVTALLSAVALYLSIPKVSAEAATISDRIFLFDYMAVSLMIAISIVRVNERVQTYPGLARVLKLAHIVVVPLLCIGMAFYVMSLDTGYLPSVTVATGVK